MHNLTRFFTNRKIGTKITVLAGIGIFGLCLVGGIYFFVATLQTAKQHLAAEISSIAKLESEALAEMLQARRAEKDFLLRRDEKYVKLQGSHVDAAVKHLDSMKQRLIGIERSELL